MAFSLVVMAHFHEPRNVGVFESPSGEGWSGSPDLGRFMQLQVVTEEGRIREARYRTYGCVPAIAAGSVVTEWARGRTLAEARALQRADLVELVGGLPEFRLFCADLALEALRGALDDAEARP